MYFFIYFKAINDDFDLSLPPCIIFTFLENFQKIPGIGEKTSYGNLRITINEVDGSRISKVRIRKRLEE